MKKRWIALISVGAVFALLGGFVGGVVLNGTYFPSKVDIKDYSNAEWMSYLSDETKVNEIVMPGSHDAGSCSINWLGKTQGYDIKTQLEMGARYFDLRVNKTEDGYYLYHAYFDGENFIDAFDDIVTFIKENTEETLILDFQHFNGNSQSDVLKIIQENLVEQDLIVANESEVSDLEYVSSLTLGEARGKCVVVFGDKGIADNYNYLFNRNNDECENTDRALNSYYFSDWHAMGSEQFIAEALPYYYEAIQDKIESEGYKGLFVLQGQLTDGNLIFGPYSKEKSHAKNMSEYIKALKDDSEKLSLTNVIMRDFLTYGKCEEIIALNGYKGNVKSDLLDAFNSKFN